MWRGYFLSFWYDVLVTKAQLPSILLIAQDLGKAPRRRALHDQTLWLFRHVSLHRGLFPALIGEESVLQNSLCALRAVDFQ